MELSISQRARDAFWKGEYGFASELYREALLKYPEMWWLELEWTRAKNGGVLLNAAADSKQSARFFFTPNYQGNSYQRMLYGNENSADLSFVPIDSEKLPLLIDQSTQGGARLVFHHHWLQEIYRNRSTGQHSVDEVIKYFRQLRLLKSLGAKIVWTVHNLYDHDLTEAELELNHLCLTSMCACADMILVHSTNTISELEALVKTPIRARVELLKHPLYTWMKKIGLSAPPELSGRNVDGRIKFLMFGMIRPYKGGLDLLHHFLEQLDQGELQNATLVLAGRIYDPELKRTLERNTSRLGDRLIVIDRRISDEELAYLCRNCDVAVMPYTKILVSGSYYQATTFALPSIVPDTGMFKTEVIDGLTGIKYQNTEQLGATLVRAMRMGRAVLRQTGAEALAACVNQDEAAISSRFRALIGSLTGKTDE